MEGLFQGLLNKENTRIKSGERIPAERQARSISRVEVEKTLNAMKVN